MICYWVLFTLSLPERLTGHLDGTKGVHRDWHPMGHGDNTEKEKINQNFYFPVGTSELSDMKLALIFASL